MSQWPEPTHDKTEPPRWGKWGAYAVIIAAVAVFATNADDQWRMPAFALPEFSLPDFELPAFDFTPDQTGTPTEETPPAVAVISEDPLSSLLPQPTEGPDGSTVQRMPYADCLSVLDNLTNSLGQPATIIEDTANRRVAAFKFLDSNLRVTCDGAQGTMSVQGDDAARVAP